MTMAGKFENLGMDLSGYLRKSEKWVARMNTFGAMGLGRRILWFPQFP
jgi:hypothetical protein